MRITRLERRSLALVLPLAYCLQLALIITIAQWFFAFEWNFRWSTSTGFPIPYQTSGCVAAGPSLPVMLFDISAALFLCHVTTKVALCAGYRFLRRPIHQALSAR